MDKTSKILGNNPVHIFFSRLGIVFFGHFFFKSLDYSFFVFDEMTLRGTTFSIGFVTLWMLTWYFADSINKKTNRLRQFNRFIINLVIGFMASWLTSIIYRYWDVTFYGNEENWVNNTNLNPELTVSLMLFYIVSYGINENFQKVLQVKDGQLVNSKIENQKIIAQFKSLKAQFEPHFLFNSLGVLSSIVHSNPDLATKFIEKLSNTLRYFIEQNDNLLVPIEKELQIVADYFFLLKIRFNESINLENCIDLELTNEWYTFPGAIQILIENAIKHNKHSTDFPLRINIALEADYFVVRNNINKRDPEFTTTTIGLKNIINRFELINARPVIISNKEGFFEVKIPILTQYHYEYLNYRG